MAKFKVVNHKGKYFDSEAKYDLIEYILNPQKVKHGFLGGVAIDPLFPAESMELVSEKFQKTKGVQLRHHIVAFMPYELNNPCDANEIAKHIARYIGKEYQIVFAVHEDKPYLHIHYIFNTVSYVDGHKYRGKYEEFHREKAAILLKLREYGITRLEYIPSAEKENHPGNTPE